MLVSVAGKVFVFLWSDQGRIGCATSRAFWIKSHYILDRMGGAALDTK